MAPEAKKRFCELKIKSPNRVLCFPKVSVTMNELVPKHLQEISQIECEVQPGLQPSDPEKTFLSAYYFQCAFPPNHHALE